jgi:hypothetical protein
VQRTVFLNGRIAFLLVTAVSCGRGVVVSTATPAERSYRVHITFMAPDSIESAAQEYRQIWAAEGDRMVDAMERTAGLRFVNEHYPDTNIRANVIERASNSGYRDSPMTMRASYPADTKRATLMHELGHRLMSGLFRRDEEEHDFLFLWLYDAWSSLYGRAFADAQVAIEKRRGQRYVDAWNSALASDSAGRAQRWREIRDERLSTRR